MVAFGEQAEPCRICLQDSDQKDLIQPCLCKGSQQFVHRSCLDEWRATHHNANCFDQCGTCLFRYIVEVDIDPVAESKRIALYRFLVARDIAIALTFLNIVVAILGSIVYAADSDRKFQAYLNISAVGTYYLMGWFLLFALTGFMGCCFAMCSDRGHNDSMCFCYCYDCPSGGGGSSDDGAAIVLLVVCLVLAVFGLFIGMVLFSEYIAKVSKDHMHVLWKHQEAKKFRVKDFSGTAGPEQHIEQHGADPDIVQNGAEDRNVLLNPKASENFSDYVPKPVYMLPPTQENAWAPANPVVKMQPPSAPF